MATTFQSCPGCTSLILSDTAECPECGHVFDASRAKASSVNREKREMKNQQMYDTCRNCGEQVRSGLVRCFNCNAFMRKDVEARFREMQSTPQQIIFSDIPKEERTEYLDAEERAREGYRAKVFDADANEFSLRDGEDDFQLNTGRSGVTSPSQPGKNIASGQASAKTPAAEIAAVPAKAAVVPSETAKQSQDVKSVNDGSTVRDSADKSAGGSPKKSIDDFDVDDLVGIAMQDQRETRRRKRSKIEEARKRRILLPCACGAWVRVREDQGGRMVRCTQCKKPMVVPMMKKKEKVEKVEAVSQVDVTWIGDLHMYVVTPTQITLKPGSLQKAFETVDGCFHDSGLFLIKYTAPKKALFGKSAEGPPDIEGQKAAVREHIQKTGAVSNLPYGELYSITADQVDRIRLVQPVANAHESMFAGVSVFGEGQIALYLPVELPEGKQAYLSFPLSTYRKVAAQLENRFSLKVGAEENGVPSTEEFDALKCFLSEVKIESLKHLEYYQNDPAFELEVSGFICGTCGAAITEEARARKKLGGAAGKGLAKAKCPKCSNKFGPLKAYKISKAPGDDEKEAEAEEDVSDVLKPKAKPKAAKPRANSKATVSNETGLTTDMLQGKWRMLSVGKNGNFAEPEDMGSANITFEITGDAYVVTVGENIVEQGSIKVDTDQDPAHFDQHVSVGEDKGKSHLGLVRIVDGKLQNCQGDVDTPRPISFESSDNKSASLAVFERA